MGLQSNRNDSATGHQPRDKNPTQRRTEEQLEKKEQGQDGKEGKLPQRRPSPSDFFNGA